MLNHEGYYSGARRHCPLDFSRLWNDTSKATNFQKGEEELHCWLSGVTRGTKPPPHTAGLPTRRLNHEIEEGHVKIRIVFGSKGQKEKQGGG